MAGCYTNAEYTGRARLLFSERFKLCLLAFTGCIMNYMMRANLSIAVVCMTTDFGPGSNSTTNSSQSTVTNGEAEFTWSRLMRGWILGGFSLGYFICQVPFGMLTLRVGARWLMIAGISLFTLLTFLTPVVARASPYALVVVQAGKGVGCSVFYTSIMYLWGVWVPPAERSRFNAFYSCGALIGIVLSFSLSGYLCEHGFGGGWPSIFYVPGMVGVVWVLGWLYFAYDSPDTHPRVSIREKRFIKQSLEHIDQKLPPVPWKSLLLSRPLQAIFVAEISYGWGWYTLMTSLPQFMHDAFQFDIKENALVSALPYVACGVVSLIYSSLADYLVRERKLAVVNVRKISYTIGVLIPGMLLVTVGYLPLKKATMAVVFMTLALGVLGIVRSAHFVNLLDIAPRYASVTMGIINSNVFALLAPVVNGALVPTGSRTEWQHVFWLNAGLQIGGVLFYCVCAKGEVQPWAMVPEKTEVTETNKHLVKDTQQQNGASA